MERDELSAWLRVVETVGIGRTSARRLLAAFGSPEGVIAASAASRIDVAGAAAEALTSAMDRMDALTATTLAWLAAADSTQPRAVIALGDPRYPRSLLDSAD